MTLIADSGALYALYDADDRHHRAVSEALGASPGPVIVPSVLLCEVDYLLLVVAKDLKTVLKLRADSTEKAPDGSKVITHERGDRYIDLANQVGNGSFAMDIGTNDYAPILEKIGLENYIAAHL